MDDKTVHIPMMTFVMHITKTVDQDKNDDKIYKQLVHDHVPNNQI